MQQKEMSTKTLSQRTGISVNTINMYTGYREAIPSAIIAVKLARALGVTVEYLVDGTMPVLERKAETAADQRAVKKAHPSIYALIADEIKKTPKENLIALLELVIRFNREKGE